MTRDLSWLQHWYDLADPNPESVRFVNRNRLDWRTIEAKCSLLTVCLAWFRGPDNARRFRFDRRGVPSVVIGVHPAKGETPIDLVAWPMGKPGCFATHLGEAEVLGSLDATLSTHTPGRPLHIHKTPEAWLLAHCTGAVALNEAAAGYWLSQLPGPFLADGLGQGRVLAESLKPFRRERDVLVASPRGRAAA
jgi:hypothetical protein